MMLLYTQYPSGVAVPSGYHVICSVTCVNVAGTKRILTNRFCPNIIRDLVKLKKSQKIQEKLGLGGPYPPTSIQFFFILKHVQQKNNTEKHQISKKKDKSELGLDAPTHPPTSEFFSDFWFFFQLYKTPKLLLNIRHHETISNINRGLLGPIIKKWDTSTRMSIWIYQTIWL